jgi:hypothetical protein
LLEQAEALQTESSKVVATAQQEMLDIIINGKEH